MSELAKLGRVKLETEIADISYRLVDLTVNDKRFRVAVLHWTLKKPLAPGDEARDTARLIATFAKEFLPKHDVLVLSGRAPIWFYSMLLHNLAHVAKAIGIFDPKLIGAVIVAVHYYEVPWQEGDVVTLPEQVVKQLTQ